MSCPNCGYCSACGRGKPKQYPYYPSQPYPPYWYYEPLTGTSTPLTDTISSHKTATEATRDIENKEFLDKLFPNAGTTPKKSFI